MKVQGGIRRETNDVERRRGNDGENRSSADDAESAVVDFGARGVRLLFVAPEKSAIAYRPIHGPIRWNLRSSRSPTSPVAREYPSGSRPPAVSLFCFCFSHTDDPSCRRALAFEIHRMAPHGWPSRLLAWVGLFVVTHGNTRPRPTAAAMLAHAVPRHLHTGSIWSRVGP